MRKKVKTLFFLCLVLLVGLQAVPITPVQAACSSYLYGSKLTGEAKRIYNALTTLSNKSNGITLKFNYDCSKESFETVKKRLDQKKNIAIAAYEMDYPEKILWTDEYYYYSGFGGRDGTRRYVQYKITFMKTKYYSASDEKRMNQKIGELVSKAPKSSRYATVKYFHDWVAKYTSYKYASDTRGKTAYRYYRAVGCYLDHYGTCSAYSKAFKAACDKAGIPCILDQNSQHMWNYVQMDDGKWYVVDVTWDDPIGGSKPVYYDYFLVPLDKDHQSDTGCKIPSISKTKYTAKKVNLITAKNISKTVSNKSQSFYIGAKTNGNAKLSYRSNNKSIKVNSKGKVSVAKNYTGKATITIRASETSKYNGAMKKITVTIRPK